MIIANGTIRFLKSQDDGGIDQTTGYAKAATVTEGAPVPCQFTPKMNLISKENGESVTRITYSILCEHLHPRCITERLKLYDGNGREIGEFSVRSIEPLKAVCQTRITV